MDDPIFDHDIFGIENIGVANDGRKMLTEFIQGGVRAVTAGFDLDGGYLSPFGDQKIDLHVVFAIPIIGSGIEIQKTAKSRKSKLERLKTTRKSRLKRLKNTRKSKFKRLEYTRKSRDPY